MAALLSSEIDDGNKRDILVEHIADARKLGVEVLPPDVNRGEADFTVQNDRIVFGLTAIKGLGRGAAEEIVRAREAGGPFKDLFDFCERIDRRIVPKAGDRTADQGRRVRRLRPARRALRGRAQGAIRRPTSAPRTAAAARRASSTCSRAATTTARRSATARATACPTCPSGPKPRSSSSRRKPSTSTSPATRWPSTTSNSAASARTSAPRCRKPRAAPRAASAE